MKIKKDYKSFNKKVRKKPSISSKQGYFITALLVIMLLAVGILDARANKIAQEQRAQSYELLKNTTTPSPTATPKKLVNTDPITDCESSYPNCKGESIRLRQSQCSKITCCQVGSTWSVYPSTEKCKEAQKSVQPQQINAPQAIPAANKVPVFLTYGKYTIYCPSQNVDAVKSIDATMNTKGMEWAKQFNDCVTTFRNNDNCYMSCSSTLSTRDRWCIDNISDWTSTEYNACTEAASQLYGECIKTCPSTSAACDWVYSEQKNMSSQISNLCK